MSRRRLVAIFVLLAIVAGGVVARLDYVEKRKARKLAEQLLEQKFAQCLTAGRSDQVATEKGGTSQGTLIQGWLIAKHGGAVALEGRPEIFPVSPAEARNDVQGVFPKCAAAGTSGFSVRLPVGA